MSNEIQIIPAGENRLAAAEPILMTAARTDREAVTGWLAQYEVKATFRAFRKESDRFMRWVEFHGLTLNDLRVEHFTAYMLFLANPEPREYWCVSQEPKYINRRLNTEWKHVKAPAFGSPDWKPFVSDLGPSAIALARSAVFGMMEYLANAGYVRANPMRAGRKRKALKMNPHIDRYLPDDALSAVMSFLRENSSRDHDRALFAVRFLAHTGLRRDEFATATTAMVYEDETGAWLKIVGKGDKPADVPIPDDAMEALEIYRRSLSIGPLSIKDEPLLFSLSGKRAVSADSVYAIVKKAFGEAASFLELSAPRMADRIRKASTHWLRHTSATLQLKAGVPLTIVQGNMRHSSLNTTQRYLHHEREERQKATKGFSVGKVAR